MLADLSICPWVLPPHGVELCRHGQHQGGQVSQGQVEQVDVGGRPHVPVRGEVDQPNLKGLV